MKILESSRKFIGGMQIFLEKLTNRRLLNDALSSGEPFRNAPYYDIAEPDIDEQWENLIWPFLKDKGIDFHCVLDLAAGHGRNSAKLIEYADRIVIVDINQENIDVCKKRFYGDERFLYIKNNGISLRGVRNNSITFVYTFDSMVHFDSDVVRAYLREFYRVLKPGGYGFCHHSNYTENPGSIFTDNPHWRNFMSKELFAHYCYKEGLIIEEQMLLDWSYSKLDCLSLFMKSAQ